MLVFAMSVSIMCLCKTLWEGTVTILKLLIHSHFRIHIQSPKCMSQASIQAPRHMCVEVCQGCSVKTQRIRDGELCSPHVACILLRLVALLLVLAVLFCTLWELAVISLPILPHLCYPNKSLRFIHFSLSPNLGVLRSCTWIVVAC